MSQNLNDCVTIPEIAREITKFLAQKTDQNKDSVVGVTPQQVQSVYKCIGNFLNFMFAKKHYEWVLGEVFSLGTFLRNANTNTTEFVPSHQM